MEWNGLKCTVGSGFSHILTGGAMQNVQHRSIERHLALTYQGGPEICRRRLVLCDPN